MRIYKKAFPLLLVIGTTLLLINILILFCWSHIIMQLVLITGFIVLYVFIIRFFRIPERSILPDENLVYAQADGTVVAVEEVFEEEFLKSLCLKISIFMSVFDVHQNRIPISGKVVYLKHHPGKYLVAWHPKSSLKNERNSLVIQISGGNFVLIRQIAGIVARRIICDLEEGDVVKQGDELGFILFGSRVDVFLPHRTKIMVNLGGKVKANEHVIADICTLLS